MKHGDCRSYCRACEAEEAELRRQHGREWSAYDEKFTGPLPEPTKLKEPPPERYWPAHSSI